MSTLSTRADCREKPLSGQDREEFVGKEGERERKGNR